jgi:MOSC domain-containing protein YiiM
MKILSIQAGKTKKLFLQDREFNTAIAKKQIPGPVFLDKLGLVGDEIGNLTVHGGEGRALYAFSRKAYDLWKGRVDDEKLAVNGLFGENITMEDLDEHQVNIGDHFSLGETLLEATMPRFPCFIMADHLGDDQGMDFMNNHGRPGVLFRVLKTGHINVGDELKLVKKSEIPLTMMQLLQMARVGQITREKLDYLKSLNILPQITIDRMELRLIHGR